MGGSRKQHRPAAQGGDVTVSAWVGSTNLGDELVAAALVAKLRARGAVPVLLSRDPAGTQATHGAPAVSAPALLQRRGARPGAVLLGGGGLLQDETSSFNLPFHLLRTALAAVPGRPVAGVGLGAGPLATRAGRALLRRALPRAFAISVRDEHSRAALAELGVRATLAADLAIGLPIPQVEVEDRLAVSLRPWAGRRHLLPVSWHHRGGSDPPAPPWFIEGMAAALDRSCATTGLTVHFVALQADRDDVVHRAVAALMRTPCTFATPGVSTVVAEVAASRAVVAMRYHAGVAALLGGRPAALIGYSPKVAALAGDVPGGMCALSWQGGALTSLPTELGRLLDEGGAVVEARARLRERERRNDDVVDAVLEAAAT